MPRQRKTANSKTARVDSGSEVEEIPRKTLVEQIESSYPTLQSGVPFDIKKMKIPLAEALSGDSKEGISFNEYHIPTGTVKKVTPTKDEDEDDDELSIGDVGETLFYAVPMTMLLFG